MPCAVGESLERAITWTRTPSSSGTHKTNPGFNPNETAISAMITTLEPSEIPQRRRSCETAIRPNRKIQYAEVTNAAAPIRNAAAAVGWDISQFGPDATAKMFAKKPPDATAEPPRHAPAIRLKMRST